MKRYWKAHSLQWEALDYNRDPDGLGNVCCAGEPLWLNQHYARLQKMAYQKLFSFLPLPSAGARALDIGCGAGRWCRFLKEHGYRVVGIDLQPELIKKNCLRHAGIEFLCVPVQEYAPRERFDLVSSVTVIQHIPFDEQTVAIRKIRALLKTKGYALILENISSQAPHVFSNSIQTWKENFERCNFRQLAIQRYDYNLLGRMYWSATRPILSVFRKSPLENTRITPEALAASSGQNILVKSPLFHLLHAVDHMARRLFIGPDALVEFLLNQSKIPFPAAHCGFLFQAI